jgi:arylsulfatase A-like enzyme
LAEILWRQGYRTSALTGGAQLAYRFGFSRGFETHRIERWVRRVERVVEELERNRNRRSFLFLHTYEIHDPYQHSELATGLDRGRLGESFERATLESYGKNLTATEREYVTALYDSGIRYVDGQLESLFTQLEAGGLLDNTLVVVTSDHGEELWDHGGWGHGHAMFDHQIHVPLLLHLPSKLRAERHLQATEGGVVDQQVRLVDLYPTLLDLLGVPLQHRIQGRSVVPMLAGRRMPPADAFSESTYWGPLEVKSLRAERYKLMTATPKNATSDLPGWTALFDLQADPAELRDIAAEEDERRQQMKTLLDLLTADGDDAEPTIPSDLDPELEEQLRALGYLG